MSGRSTPVRRIFIASPDDLAPERQRLVEVVNKIARDAPGDPIQAFAYEFDRRVMDAGTSWQLQIPWAGRDNFEVLVCLFGERLGNPLSDDGPLGFAIPAGVSYGSQDGHYPLTGTLFELYEAMDARRRRAGVPKILLYLKGDETILDRRRRYDQRNWGGRAHYRQLEQDAHSRGHFLVPKDVSDEYWQQLEWLTLFVNDHTSASLPTNRVFLEPADFEGWAETDLREVLGLAKPMTTNVGKGLKSYGVGDKHIFFGRTPDIRRIVGALQDAFESPHSLPLLILHGRSGTGKSSVMRAGIAARLEDGSFAQSVGAAVDALVLTPAEMSRDPFGTLWERLTGKLPELPAAVEPRTAAETLREILGTRRVFLAIDQFEEVLVETARGTPSSWDPVIDFLFEIARRRLGYAAIVIKENWLQDWLDSSWVRQAKDSHQLRYDEFPETLEKSTLFEIVNQSFEAAGFVVDAALHEHLWREFRQLEGRGEAVLPLLSVALEWLGEEWGRRSGQAVLGVARVLDGSYAASISLRSLLAALGDRAFRESQCTPEQLARVLRSLVTMTIDGAVHRRTLATASRADFATEDGRLLDALAMHRLADLTDHTVRLTHDALVDNWPRATDWWNEEKQHVETRTDLMTLLHIGAELPAAMLDRAERLACDWRDQRGIEPSSDISSFVQKEMQRLFDPRQPSTSDGEPRLADAVRLGNTRLATHMLAAGADVNVQSRRAGFEDTTPLIVAASNGRTELIDLLVVNGARLEMLTRTGYAALAAAAYWGHLDAVRRLLEHGSNPNAVDGESRVLALTVAADRGHRAIVEALLDAGANVNETKAQQTTALAAAIYNGHLDLAQLLLRRGATLAVPADVQWDIASLAAQHGDAALMAEVIARGADPAKATATGMSALALAAAAGRVDVVELLIESGRVDVNAVGAQGRTALAEAMTAGQDAAAAALVAAGSTVPFWYEADERGTIAPLSRERLEIAFARQIEAATGGEWPAPPLLDGDWVAVGTDEAAAILAETFQRISLNRFGTGLSRVDAVRRRPLPFYDGAVLYEARATRDEKAAGSVTFVRHAAGAWLLDGTSPPIHEMNARLGIKLHTPDQVATYTRFFCHSVTAEYGAFKTVERAEQLTWRKNVPPGVRDRAARRASPIAVGERDAEGFWPVSATVQYSNVLFTARFKVFESGTIEMTDDQPVETDLPLFQEVFEFGVRRLVPAGIPPGTADGTWFTNLTRAEKAYGVIDRLVKIHKAQWDWDLDAVRMMACLLAETPMSRGALFAKLGMPPEAGDATVALLAGHGWAAVADDTMMVYADPRKAAEMAETLAVFARHDDSGYRQFELFVAELTQFLRVPSKLMHAYIVVKLESMKRTDRTLLMAGIEEQDLPLAESALQALLTQRVIGKFDDETAGASE